LARDIFGKWVKVNLIHSGATDFGIQIYLSIDGVPQQEARPFQFEMFDADGSFYIKYGAYCGHGQRHIVQWRNTRVWKKQ